MSMNEKLIKTLHSIEARVDIECERLVCCDIIRRENVCFFDGDHDVIAQYPFIGVNWNTTKNFVH